MTAQAQGEQGRWPTTAVASLLRGGSIWGFFAWLMAGPFLIAAGPDAARNGRARVYVAGMLIMFGTSAAFHRFAGPRRPGAGCDERTTARSSSGSRRPTAVVGLALRGWAELLILTLVWVGAGRASRCASSFWTHRNGSSPFPTWSWAGVRSSWRRSWCGAWAERVHADVGGRVVLHRGSGGLRRASGRTHGHGSSASTRSSTPAPWSARGCSPTWSPSSLCRATRHIVLCWAARCRTSPGVG